MTTTDASETREAVQEDTEEPEPMSEMAKYLMNLSEPNLKLLLLHMPPLKTISVTGDGIWAGTLLLTKDAIREDFRAMKMPR
jgi:hypothetical protein